MYQKVRPLFLYCETPLHAGSGSDLGIVDLPIQRERHTGYPKIESSSLKGALREDFESNTHEVTVAGKSFKVNDGLRSKSKGVGIGKPLTLAFGPEGDEANEAHAGALAFTDARLLLFPVKSMKGVFVWITCPAILRRLERDMRLVDEYKDFRIDGIPGDLSQSDASFAAWESDCEAEVSGADVAILEEYTFALVNSYKDKIKVKENGQDPGTGLGKYLCEKLNIQDNYLNEKMRTDILVLSDDDFRDFVEMSTEVITRTKIDNETGTVQKGGLFTEEYLPSDSLMYSMVMSAPVFQKSDDRAKCDIKEADEVMEYFAKGLRPIIQLGANATLGKGLLRTTLLNPQNQVQ